MTIKIGFQIVPQHGPSMKLMRDRWMEAEALGVDTLYTADHFFAQASTPETLESPSVESLPKPVDSPNFEALTIQTAMAATTTRPEIGCLVHSIGYRNPNLLADMARTIDHISGGRFILGLGSGYQQKDYEDYGYQWGTPKSRMMDLMRDIPIIKDRFTKLNPLPTRKIPILIAAKGEKLGMRVVAEHADIWHVHGTLEYTAQKIESLKAMCKEVGRNFSDIELATWYAPNITKVELDPGEYVKLGIRNIVQLQNGPVWDLGLLRELLAWRKGFSG